VLKAVKAGETVVNLNGNDNVNDNGDDDQQDDEPLS